MTRPEETIPLVVVRPMELEEVEIRIDYFHDASDEYLAQLGADRARMPSRDAWRVYYAEDFARPLAERETYNLIWEVDDRAIGFSSVDHIDFGEEAFMHLHIARSPSGGAASGPNWSVSRRPSTSVRSSLSGSTASRTPSTSRRTGPCSGRASATSSPRRCSRAC